MVYWGTFARYPFCRMPVNLFAERLPWRIAALAGLLVGGISLAWGADPWECLLRVGAAFALFGALGLGLRAVLRSGPPPSASPPPPEADGRGRHFDATTPDAHPPDDAS